MQRTLWTDRKFAFDFPEGWIYNIVARLRGTVPRLHWLVQSLTDEQLAAKSEGKWSIKEHIGHLADLEPLHEGRIDDFINRVQTLRPADMANQRTNEANHNAKNSDTLIGEFDSLRQKFISRLLSLDDHTQYYKAIHPRLRVSLRPVDIAYFVAEHDDHHLAHIYSIAKNLME